jgi:hypothetical protein
MAVRSIGCGGGDLDRAGVPLDGWMARLAFVRRPSLIIAT